MTKHRVSRAGFGRIWTAKISDKSVLAGVYIFFVLHSFRAPGHVSIHLVLHTSNFIWRKLGEKLIYMR